jgi:hypothetical protein
MTREYVEQRDSAYWITGSRVSLDSVIYRKLDEARQATRS